MRKKKEEMKKRRPKRTRKVRAKVTVGKKPAEKMKGKRKDREQKLEEEIELDYKEEISEDEEEKEMNLKEKEEKKAEDAKKWNWLLPNSSSLFCFFVFPLTLFSNNVQDSDLFGLAQSEEMSSRLFSTRRVRVPAASTQLPRGATC